METITNSTEETEQLARKIAEKIKPGDVLALYGDLGAGKTTFTKFLVKALGFENKVQSPTFVLARVYETSSNEDSSRLNKINHLDLYRLRDKKDVENFGIKEYFDQPNSITIIEWPEMAENYLPKETIKVIFTELGENKRKINVQNLH